eukprot:gi/632965621/ref/XP_007898982.1/ PREDICTED: seizure protein 6 homolog [Callorhinchus milii]
MSKNSLCCGERLEMKAICFLLVLLVKVCSQDQLNGEINAVSGKGMGMETGLETEIGPTVATTTSDLEARSVSTAPALSINNHHLLLEEILHESLLKKDYLGQEGYFAGSLGANVAPTGPVSDSRDPSVTQVVTEDPPFFPEVATTTTVAPTTTTLVSMVTDAIPLADFEGAAHTGAARLPVTTDSLTTAGGSQAPETAFHNSNTALARTEPGTKLPVTKTGTRGNPDPQVATTALADHAPTPGATVTTAGTAGMLQMQGPGTGRADTSPPETTMAAAFAVEADEETTTTTIITTTIITTVQTPVPCSLNFTDQEGHIESPEYPSHLLYTNLDCTYSIIVYTGYGVELQVKNISLSEGEMLTIEGLDGDETVVLANESILMKGQVIRSPSNQVSIHFQSFQLGNPGSFQFRYQAYLLSCGFPHKPSLGDVSVTSLHPGGEARFYCNLGYQLQGPASLTCINGSKPQWSDQEPQCIATCGGVIRNATGGRIISPNFPGNYSNNLTCHWLLQAPEGQRLHLHFEKVALAEDDDRLIIRNGNSIDSPPVYDSFEVEYLPIEGLVSSFRHFFIELSTDGSVTSTGLALRYEAFKPGHCYEPFIKYGNFTTSDAAYPAGTVAEFSCDPGYTLEQGSVIIECLDSREPQWNETEPACRAVCSGEITDSGGVVLSPNWPEAFDKGQDCIWGIHVEEDKRIMLDVEVMNMGENDVLTIYDGDDLTASILGQYSGIRRPFKLYTSMADVTMQFQSDPATTVFGYQQGFVVRFYEVLRNDTCPELPEILNGWKTTSHPELIHGTVVTYQCYPGYDLVGADILMCQWDLSWSGDTPACEKIIFCSDPGDLDHSRRIISDAKFSIGSTVQYICDKGYALTGSNILTCYNRQSGNPKWSDRIPKCIRECEPCHNPGAPDNGYQATEKRFYQAGETLRFACYEGYHLTGDVSLRCIPGHPSQWSSSPPSCKVAYDQYFNERRLEVAKAAATVNQMEGSNLAIVIFVPVIIVALLIGGIYVYFTKFQSKSTLRLPLATSHPYDHITVESAFDNPIYETGAFGCRC